MAGGVGVTGGPWAAAGTMIFPADAANGAWGNCKSGAGCVDDMPDASGVPIAANGLAGQDLGSNSGAWPQGSPPPPVPAPDTTPAARPGESQPGAAPASEPPGSGSAVRDGEALLQRHIRDMNHPLTVSANGNCAVGGRPYRLRRRPGNPLERGRRESRPPLPASLCSPVR